MVVDRFSDTIIDNPKLNVNPALKRMEQERRAAGPQVHEDPVGV
jgi:hypothetical protein